MLAMLAGVLLGGLIRVPAAAQGAPPAQDLPPVASGGPVAAPRVAAVELRLDGRVRDPERLESLVEVTVGAPLDAAALRRTLAALHATGLFSRLEAVSRPAPGGGIVVMLLAERPPRVRELRFEGDLEVWPLRVRRRFPQREDAPFSAERMDEGVRSALELYRRRGYFDAAIDWRREPARAAEASEPGASDSSVSDPDVIDLVVTVDAGPQVEPRDVRFEGDQGPYGRRALIDVLRLRERYDPERIADGAERLRRFLVERGHLSATVEPPFESYEGGELDLVYRVDAGPLYEVHLVGVERRWLERRGFLPLDDRPLTAPQLAQGCQRLRDHLQSKGYFYARVDCRIEDLGPAGPEAALDVTRRLVVDVERGEPWRVVEVSFAGNERLPTAQLEPLLRVAPHRRLRPGSGRLVSSELQEDLDNLRSYYLLQGFLDAEIAPAMIVERGPGELAVKLEIDEGERRRVVDVALDGVAAIDPGEALSKLPLQPGGGYHPLRLEDSLNVLRTLYEEAGYPSALIEPSLDWGAEGLLVDVRFEVEEGRRRTLDRLVLRGLQRTRPRLVEAYSGLEPGEVLSRRKLLEAERELYRLGLFSEADVALVPASGAEAERSVAIRVEEGRGWRLAYGLSYHSDDGLGGLLGLSRNNLRGLGERLQLDLRASENDNRLRLFYDQPMPFGVRVPLTWTVFLRHETRPTYDVEESGFRLQAVRDLTAGDGATVRLGLIYDYRLVELDGDLFDLRLVEREDREAEISSLAPNVLVDRRDDPLDPTLGWSVAAQLEYAFPFIDAEANYLKLFTQATRYVDLGDVGTLAGSVRLGLIEPLGDPVIIDPVLPSELESSRIPISERFFAGGRTTHRAYERDSLGLLGQSLIEADDGRLFEVGGNGLLLLNLDYRFPIRGALGGVAFLDLGNVWADWRDLDLDDLRPGLGLGLRYASPVGPIRLEIGWKADPQPFEDDGPIFLLSFGNPF